MKKKKKKKTGDLFSRMSGKEPGQNP